ncbi:unnamed protein product [Paramecium sonneborni]|uniref:Protein kinase domain-containing protein n=1 Tax=Paramecium sonneborni TaxID=65129 RepID=A0A8S1MV84_9CILI|nr:unnamed protein product [Paramecium sonneborni]
MEIKKVGNYTLYYERQLGKGVLGEVIEGERIDNKEKVAVKIVKKSALQDKQRFENIGLSKCLQREIIIQKSLNNPNIIKMYEAKESANNIYMFMEKGDCTLLDYQKQKLFDNDSVTQLMKQLLSALQYMSEVKIINQLQDDKEYEGICHLDLKPQNILMVGNIPKITDFGMSIQKNQEQSEKLLNSEDELCQTHHFYLGKGTLV